MRWLTAQGAESWSLEQPKGAAIKPKGTDLATSTDSPNIGVVYKMVELDGRYTAKFSEGKHSMPGSKQVFRYPTHDQIACSWECPSCGSEDGPVPRALLHPVILGGRLVEPLPDPATARGYALECLKRLPTYCRSLFDSDQKYPVEYSPELQALLTTVVNQRG